MKKRLFALAMALALLLTGCTGRAPGEEEPAYESQIELTARPLVTEHTAQWYWDNYLADLVYLMQGNYPTSPLHDQTQILEYCAARYARDTDAVPTDKEAAVALPMPALEEYAARYFGVDVRQYDWGGYGGADAVFRVYCASLMNDLTGVYEDWAFRLLEATERADEPGVVDVRIGHRTDDPEQYPDGYEATRTVTLVHTGEDRFAIREVALEYVPNLAAGYTVEGARSSVRYLAGDYVYRLADLHTAGDDLMILQQMEPDRSNYEDRLSEVLMADPATGEIVGRWFLPEAVDSHTATRPNGMPILLGSRIYLPEEQRSIEAHLLTGEHYPAQMGFTNDLQRAVVRDENASIWLYDVASGESDLLLPAGDGYTYYHPCFTGDEAYFYCERYAEDLFAPDALILQHLPTGKQFELPLSSGESPSPTVMADDKALYTLTRTSAPLTPGVFEVTVYPLENPPESRSYTLHTDLAPAFYNLGQGRALIQTTELRGRERTYKQLLLDLATGEVTDTGFTLQTVTEGSSPNMLRIWFVGCSEAGVGNFVVTSSLNLGESALYTAQLFAPDAQ